MVSSQRKMNKKNIILFLTTSLALPCYANMEICNSSFCLDWREDTVQSVETAITSEGYGVKVKLKNGHEHFFPADTRKKAITMLNEAYSSIRDYYGWSNSYYYYILNQQDKAQLRKK